MGIKRGYNKHKEGTSPARVGTLCPNTLQETGPQKELTVTYILACLSSSGQGRP